MTDLKPGDLVTVTRKPTPEELKYIKWRQTKDLFINDLAVVTRIVSGDCVALRRLDGDEFRWYFPVCVVKKL